ncbi:hypothetical protein L798_06807 [Zootermopsis nevadensis]|uniref:Uncharacterized protein n=1 Tax=Zootermopsis nevadensis TaxID=136037 RepID=A0A067R544_ZOONE|nr:hypothetical protein L798_06807 [Zootermopsis nevadensis]
MQLAKVQHRNIVPRWNVEVTKTWNRPLHISFPRCFIFELQIAADFLQKNYTIQVGFLYPASVHTAIFFFCWFFLCLAQFRGSLERKRGVSFRRGRWRLVMKGCAAVSKNRD